MPRVHGVNTAVTLRRGCQSADRVGTRARAPASRTVHGRTPPNVLTQATLQAEAEAEAEVEARRVAAEVCAPTLSPEARFCSCCCCFLADSCAHFNDTSMSRHTL